MKKYPHGLTLIAVCAAIEDYQRHEDSVPEEGILAAFNTLLAHSDIAEAFRALEKQRDALAAENASLKESRDILAKNSLETCNEVYCAGYRNTALHDGLMESTGNRNAYPNPIRAMVNEAIKQLSTPATDAYLNSVRAEGVRLFAAAVQGGCAVGDRVKDLADTFAAQLRAVKDGE